MQSTLNTIGVRQRNLEIVRLRFEEGLSTKAIASRLKTSLQTVNYVVCRHNTKGRPACITCLQEAAAIARSPEDVIISTPVKSLARRTATKILYETLSPDEENAWIEIKGWQLLLEKLATLQTNEGVYNKQIECISKIGYNRDCAVEILEALMSNPLVRIYPGVRELVYESDNSCFVEEGSACYCDRHRIVKLTTFEEPKEPKVRLRTFSDRFEQAKKESFDMITIKANGMKIRGVRKVIQEVVGEHAFQVMASTSRDRFFVFVLVSSKADLIKEQCNKCFDVLEMATI